MPAPQRATLKRVDQPLKPAPEEPRAVTAAGLSGSRPEISDVARRDMIERAAYFRAEQRGFAPGEEVTDWLAAERDVEFFLAGGAPPRGLESG